MVHEFEKIISQKIRTAEQIPAIWQRDLVWENIKSEPRQHGTFIPYYAAASLLLVASLVVYFVTGTLREHSNERIKSLEAAISQYPKTQPPVAGEEKALSVPQGCEPIDSEKTSTKRVDTHQRKRPPQLTATTTHEEAEPLALTTETQVPDPPLESEPVADTPRIEAIIGIIPPRQVKAVAAKGKKVRFKFLRGDDNSEEWKSAESYSILTARIN